MNMFAKLYLPTSIYVPIMYLNTYRPFTLNIKTCATIRKIVTELTLMICVYALNRNKHAELYLPSMFRTSTSTKTYFKHIF